MRQPYSTTAYRVGVRLLAAVYLAIGVLGFVPVEAINPASPDTAGTHYLLRHFAVNPLHNLVHLGLGVGGLWAARTRVGVRSWGRVVGTVLLILAVAGLAQAVAEGLPRDQVLLGLIPLNSPGHVFHLVTGVLALYLGLAPDPSPTSPHVRGR